MTKLVYTKYIVKVDVDCNNNKFWSCKVYSDGTFEREWGRVGYNKRTQAQKFSSENEAMKEALKIKRKKERDGYKENEEEGVDVFHGWNSSLKRGPRRLPLASHCSMSP